ncbi:MAG: hypothetical protein OQL19_07820 [Gammaproteobacteria bacterium]|nr:hypothetical protein [Gammaproteobacteria bacterium]
MLYGFLFLIWSTPALIAGMLGWSGIWGTGSAFVEYLIPLPVGGGVFHVPGLVLSIVALKVLDKDNSRMNMLVSYGAFTLLIVMLTLHIDFTRFYSWLTTDYQPYGSPIRFDSNAVYLFILTDAFWVWIYSILKGQRFRLFNSIVVIALPPVILLFQIAEQTVTGPSFEIGGSKMGKNHGQESQFVFTTASYDKELLLAWLDEKNYIGTPWFNPNTEHEAIIFTNSMQLIKWRKFDDINEHNIIATVCSYEEDKSRTIHQGLYNCFSGKETLRMKLDKISRNNPTGFHPWVNDWYARNLLCEEVSIPGDRNRHNIALYNTCIGLSHSFEKDMKRFMNSYGKDSEEMAFIVQLAEQMGLPREIPPYKLQ